MTTQRQYLTWYPMYLCNQPTWLMTSQPMHVWNHTHCMYDTIGILYDLTSTLADNTALFVCHGTHSVYDIICIIYDATHTVCITTQALYLTWNQLKLPFNPLYMSSHILCQRHHTYCVRHHRWHMYPSICIIHDIISTLYDNNPYYLWHHMHYIHYNTHIIYDISSTLYDVTFTMCGSSHNDSIYDINPICLWHIHFIWNYTQCYDHTAIVCLHSHYAWHYTQCIFDITHKVPMLWREVYLCHHSLYIYDTICTAFGITSTLYDITPCYDIHTNCIHVITPRTPVITSTVAELLLTVYSI